MLEETDVLKEDSNIAEPGAHLRLHTLWAHPSSWSHQAVPQVVRPTILVRRTSMLEETDFLKEASNIAEFGAYLDSSGMHKVATCPFVYKPFSSRRCDWHRAARGKTHLFSIQWPVRCLGRRRGVCCHPQPVDCLAHLHSPRVQRPATCLCLPAHLIQMGSHASGMNCT